MSTDCFLINSFKNLLEVCFCILIAPGPVCMKFGQNVVKMYMRAKTLRQVLEEVCDKINVVVFT